MIDQHLTAATARAGKVGALVPLGLTATPTDSYRRGGGDDGVVSGVSITDTELPFSLVT